MLQLKAGLKATAFKTARHELASNGYITFQSRGSNRAAMYQLISQQMDFQQEQDSSQALCPPEDSDLSIPSQAPDHIPNNTPDHTDDHTTGHKADPLIKQRHQQDNTKEKLAGTADAICFYQENFGVLTPFIAEDISGWITDLGEALVLDAMKLGLSQGKPTWRYVKGILKAWRQNGITTVGEAEKEELAFKQRMTKKSGISYRQQHNEIVPDWFIEHKQKEAYNSQFVQPKAIPEPDEAAKEAEEIREMLAKRSTKKPLQSVSKC